MFMVWLTSETFKPQMFKMHGNFIKSNTFSIQDFTYSFPAFWRYLTLVGRLTKLGKYLVNVMFDNKQWDCPGKGSTARKVTVISVITVKWDITFFMTHKKKKLEAATESSCLHQHVYRLIAPSSHVLV